MDIIRKRHAAGVVSEASGLIDEKDGMGFRLPRERAQLRCLEMPSQQDWNRHDEPPSFATNETTNQSETDLVIVNESQLLRFDIIPHFLRSERKCFSESQE
jgi:hypothetical protein